MLTREGKPKKIAPLVYTSEESHSQGNGLLDNSENSSDTDLETGDGSKTRIKSCMTLGQLDLSIIKKHKADNDKAANGPLFLVASDLGACK
jgi:hypothetical protein